MAELSLSDYSILLRDGDVVVVSPADSDDWRKSIRSQARADKLRVRTGQSGDRVWAVLIDAPPRPIKPLALDQMLASDKEDSP